MDQDFDKWNILKKQINKRGELFCKERDIWWCHFGLNIGVEENGKNDIFERPILVLKVYNKNMCRVVPLTSNLKNDSFHFPIDYLNIKGSLIVSHMKTISTKRLSRKMCRLDKVQFSNLRIFVKSEM